MTIAATRWETGKASRRQSIIDATKDLLREGQVVSSSNIAKRAGVSVATVYNLVGKREALIALILNELLTELGSRIDALRDIDPIQRAEAVVTVSIDMFAEDPLVYRQVVHELSGSLASVITNHITFRAVDLQIDAMTEAQRHGQIEAWVDPATSGQQILTSYNGAMTNWSGSGDSELFMCQALYGFWTAIAAYGVASERKRAIKKLKAMARETIAQKSPRK
jgi:AcrR family transcriptional regulator